MTDTRQAAPGRSWLIQLLVLVAGMFMSVLDITIVNVAIPAVQASLGTTLDEILWISTAYTLTLGIVVPLSSWLGERVGLVRLYQICLAAFALTSALCGLAWNLESLIFFRVLQAVPGGILPVITLTIVYQTVPREKIGIAMALYGMGVVFAPAVGPVLGGYLVEHTDWRLIFFVNVPMGVLGLVGAWLVLPPSRRGTGVPFDVPGFLAVGFGLSALLLAGSEGEDWGWTSYPVLILFVAGVLSLALFVVIELEVEHPLLDVRVFRHGQFTASIVLLSVLMTGLMATLFYVPVFLQQGQGLTALDAGLRIFPQALVMVVMMPIAGRLYDRIGPRWPAAVGLAVCAYGTWLLCGINPDMTEGEVIWWTCVRAIGMGLAMIPIMTGGIASLPQSQASLGSAWSNVARQVAGALGLAGLSALATIEQAQIMADRSALLTAHSPVVSALGGTSGLYGLFQSTQLDVVAESYSDVFLVATVMVGACAVLALVLRSGDAAAEAPAAVASTSSPVDLEAPAGDGADAAGRGAPARSGPPSDG